ncbi:MAG TPA: hypothetical protein VL688_12970 [Verrucomicrobiae bacterium]|nr:hypothetical protein [Verrucomicrobiae bacterium]
MKASFSDAQGQEVQPDAIEYRTGAEDAHASRMAAAKQKDSAAKPGEPASFSEVNGLDYDPDAAPAASAAESKAPAPAAKADGAPVVMLKPEEDGGAKASFSDVPGEEMQEDMVDYRTGPEDAASARAEETRALKSVMGAGAPGESSFSEVEGVEMEAGAGNPEPGKKGTKRKGDDTFGDEIGMRPTRYPGLGRDMMGEEEEDGSEARDDEGPR